MQGAQKRLQRRISPLFSLLLHNAFVIIRGLEFELKEHPSPAIEQCIRIINGFGSQIETRHYLPGVFGDVRVTPIGMQSLYKIVSTLTQNNFAAVQNARLNIEAELAGRDSAYYQSEQERLYALLMELGLTKQRSQTKRRPQTQQLPPQTAAGSGVDKRKIFAEQARANVQRRQAKRNRIVAVAAAVVVLIAAGVIWQLFRTGVISLPLGAVEPAEAVAATAGTATQEATAGTATQEATAGTATQEATAGTATQEATAIVVEEPSTPRPEEAAEQVVIRETPTGIIITLADIVRLANQISLLNGYHELGDFDSASPDPDFIYPGNPLAFPDESVHTVELDDNIWNLTADYIEDWLAIRYGQYRTLIRTDISTITAREQLIVDLRALEDGSYSENFSALIVDTIESARKDSN